MPLRNFMPHYGGGQLIAITAASQQIQLPPASNGDNKSVVVSNIGTTVFYVRMDVAGTAATTADMPVLPGRPVCLNKFGDVSTLQYIGTAGGQGHVITGEGVLTS